VHWSRTSQGSKSLWHADETRRCGASVEGKVRYRWYCGLSMREVAVVSCWPGAAAMRFLEQHFGHDEQGIVGGGS